jgi:hypothetical protein
MGEQSRCAKQFVLGMSFAAAFAAGCAPSGSGAGRQVASALCQKAAECCSDGEIRAIFGPYTTADDCTDRIVTHGSANLFGVAASIPRIGASIVLPNLTYLDQAIRENRIRVDGDMLRRCTEAITKAVCVVDAAADAGTAEPTCKPIDPTLIACDYSKLFVGQVAEGGHCATAAGSIAECVDGLFCLNVGIDGVCIPKGKEGEYCVNDGECLSTLFCNQLSGTCQLKRKVGETCAFDDSAQTDSVRIPCAQYLDCDPFARICVSKCNEGYHCSTDRDCDQTRGLRCIVGFCDSVRAENQPCADDSDCDPSLRCEPDGDPTNNYTNVCVPKLGDGASGCLTHSDCASGFCDPTSGTRTCRPKVSPPGVCPSQLNEQCAGGYCASGYCAPLIADGAACQNDYQCQSGACVALSCARPPLANGLRCTSDTQCSSGFCNHETSRYCDVKPLDNGKRCVFYTECASDVCVNGLCTNGLPVGADCTPASGKPPCDPALYCDTSLTPWSCQPKHGPGDDCTSDAQCFGDCVTMSGRMICDETAPPGGLVCGGHGTR